MKKISSWPGTYFLSRSTSHGLTGLIGRNVSVMNTENRKRLSVSHPLSHPSSYDFSTDGRHLAIKSTSGHIVIIDPQTGTTTTDFNNKKEGEGSNLCFSSDGQYIVDGSWDGVLTIRSISRLDPTYREEYWDEQISVISHDRERRIWGIFHKPKASNYNHPHSKGYVSVRTWPLHVSKPQIFSFGITISHARLSPDGSRIAFYGTDYADDAIQRLYIASAENGQILIRSGAVKTGGAGRHIAWTDDCRHIIAVAERRFLLLETEAMQRIREIPSQYPACTTILNDGDTVVFGDWQRTTFSSISELLVAPRPNSDINDI